MVQIDCPFVILFLAMIQFLYGARLLLHLQEYIYETHDQNSGVADGGADDGNVLSGTGFRQPADERNRRRVVRRTKCQDNYDG